MTTLDTFCCQAVDLTHHTVWGKPIRLRLEDDSDDPATWHPVKVIRDQGFGTDTSQPFVEELTVSFHDGMPDVVLNEMDEVEFALPRPTGGSPGGRSV